MQKSIKRATALLTSLVMVIPFFAEFPSGMFSDNWDLTAFAAETPVITPVVTADLTDEITGITLSDSDSDGYYEIGDADTLTAFANIVNSETTEFDAELTADITVNEGVLNADGTLAEGDFTEWTPIGSQDVYYEGNFNGNDFTISGLYFNDAEVSYVGLFGKASGEIKNVNVKDSYFSGNYYVGSICGYYYGGLNNSITGCTASGSVTGIEYVGGICGYVDNGDSVISNCYNTGDVTGSVWYAGGICGYNTGVVENCYSVGALIPEIAEYEYFGSICGENDYTVTNCYYLADSDDVIGGIYGSDKAGKAEAKTTAAFASGEVAYLLQGEQVEEVWGQTIGTDPYPVLGGAKVYRGYNESSCTEKVYSNEDNLSDEVTHNINSNGFCES